MSILANFHKKGYCGKTYHVLKALFIFLLSSSVLVKAQPDTAYSFIIAGHAYGAHSGGNLGLHPALLNCLNTGYDTTVSFFVFTGDIVNESTTESWQQVDDEMANYALPFYYAMGNHDANDIGRQVFEDKFGGTWYTFHSQSELFIVLNSTEEQRSISSPQIDFLAEQINQAGDTIRNVFIFFHEILWNSNEKYAGVLSNSRSRYDQMVNYSNYWEEVHPLLTAEPDIDFFVIAGDVGGNPDAISAFCDTWDNVILLASGMGEVVDENYLLVHVYTEDSIEFELIPLNSELNLPAIEYYNVPASPVTITGSELVTPGSNAIEYSVPEVFNASSYIWDLPEGATGTSISNSIALDFDIDFTGDTLSVRAARHGFGTGPASSLMIRADISPIELPDSDTGPLQIDIRESGDYLTIWINCSDRDMFTVRLFDSSGRVLKTETLKILDEFTTLQIKKDTLPKGIIFLSVSTQTHHFTEKFVIR